MRLSASPRLPVRDLASRSGVLVEREATAAAEAGLPASFVDEIPLPYATHGAARFENQAEFHPHKYVVGLARRLEQAGGRIFERTRATQVHEGSALPGGDRGRARCSRTTSSWPP